MNSDFKDLLSILDRHGVRYLVATGHDPQINKISYAYEAKANLKRRVQRSGECAAEIWSL